MAIKTVFPARVNDDLTIQYINPARIKQHLLHLRGQLVEVTVEKLRKHRSEEQNRYYRGVVLKMIADHCGYRGAEELEALHQEFRRRFLPKRGELNIPVSTTGLNTKEFSEYIDIIRQWADEQLKLYIPEPGEITE